MRVLAAVLLSAGMLGACTQLIDANAATYAPDEASPVLSRPFIELKGAKLDDNFGTEVVLQDEELLVAAPNATLLDTHSSAPDACGDNIDAPGAGRVMAFEHRDDRWTQTDELHRTSAQEGEGTTRHTADFAVPRISIARVGDTVAVGVPAADVTPCDGAAGVVAQAGKVHVFRQVDGRWTVEAVLTEAPPAPKAFFGSTVALDDDELFVSAQTTDGAATDGGAVYVFVHEDGAWRETQRIVPRNSIDDAQFGNDLAVQGDTLAVGAWFDSHPDQGIHAALDIDGTAAAGGEQVDYSGAVYTFRKRDGHWEQEAYLKPFDRAPTALFGMSVALDGDFLFVGAAGESDAAGAVYVYRRGEQDWTSEAYLTADEPRAGSLFGMSLAAESGKVLIAAPWASPADPVGGARVERAGVAYVYERVDDRFQLVASFRDPRPRPRLNLGFSTALSERYAVLGAPADDEEPGSVSIFELEP